ncbi:MAG: hypothetical protein ABIG96_04875 [Candidatus Micrarchaeota archaeon]
MQLRGQFAVEMFFAFTFAILLVFWLVSYLEMFSSESDSIAAHSSQNVITRDLGRIINDVCVYGGNPAAGMHGMRVEMQAPCLQSRQVDYFYNISVAPNDPYNLLIWSDTTNTSTSYNTSCKLVPNANLTRCGTFDKLCIYKRNDVPDGIRVHIDTGACN